MPAYQGNTPDIWSWDNPKPKPAPEVKVLDPQYLSKLSNLYLENQYGVLDKEREGELETVTAGLSKEESRLRARFSGSGLSSESFDAFLAKQLESRNKEIEWINTAYDSRKRAIAIEVGNQLTSEDSMKKALTEAGISVPVKYTYRRQYDWLGGPGDIGTTGTPGDSAAGLLGIGVTV